jgi:hypothetical protein
MTDDLDITALLQEEENIQEMADGTLLRRWEYISSFCYQASTTPHTVSPHTDRVSRAFWARLQAIEDEQARRWREHIAQNEF